MKKTIFVLIIAMFAISVSAFSQKKGTTVEVLYFKADLKCCQAATCNAISGKMQTIIEEAYPDGNVTFTIVKIADEANSELVEKYDAKSQTVVVVKKRKAKESSVDISDIVNEYYTSKDEEKFKTNVLTKIDDLIN